MTYPKSVTMAGIRIKVRVVRDMIDWGGYDNDKKEITLSRKCLQDVAQLKTTLRHELTHAALHIGGVSFMEIYDEEPIVRCLDDIFFPCWDRLQKKYEILR